MTTSNQAADQGEKQPQGQWFLELTTPVFLPAHSALTLPEAEFEAFVQQHVKPEVANEVTATDQNHTEVATDDQANAVPACEVALSEASTTGEIRDNLDEMTLNPSTIDAKTAPIPDSNHPFMQGLLSYGQNREERFNAEDKMKNKMLTENGDVAFRSTNAPLLDLFVELEDVVSGPRLLELLEGAWREDPTTTLKIIFNARSIHLGKASRHAFYRCAGWLAKNHPQTLIANLAWLSRPVIQKKVEKKDDEQKADEEDMVMVEDEMDENDPARFDVRNGVAHGYWKDLLNLLALCVNGKLDVLAHPREILNVEQKKGRFKWPKSQDKAKSLRHDKRDARHETAVKLFNEDSVYRGLHLAVARLFAARLRKDLALLNSPNKAAKRNISLCAKWAPSAERFHDKHTFIVSSISEILHPLPEFQGLQEHDPADIAQRTLYLRHAREAYRKDITALRKHLEVVERDITAGTYKNIKYDRVPSLAMNNYAPRFANKDADRFEKYIDKVASGKARISGATLLPSTMILAVKKSLQQGDQDQALLGGRKRKIKGTKDLVDTKAAAMAAKTLDLQWATLVQRIRDSGTLEDCIAVADVSPSMYSPVFPDGTTPMDSSIGLALLVAEVTRPPFGGAFITFSRDPSVVPVDPSRTLEEKYKQLLQAKWGGSTDFEAVFSRLLLPMAVENKIRPEDMVKRVFVFSDMQFDCSGGEEWATSYERVEAHFRAAGYEVPELVFWNLAGGRAGYGPWNNYGAVAPKPVAGDTKGTAIVSGYSQGMLKVFLDGGSFEDEGGEEEIVEKEADDGEVVVINKVKRQKLDPLAVVKKAIGHKAYSMLRVVD